MVTQERQTQDRPGRRIETRSPGIDGRTGSDARSHEVRPRAAAFDQVSQEAGRPHQQLQEFDSSIFVNQGIRISDGAKTWHTGRKLLIENAKPLSECDPNELWRGELDLELRLLETIESQLESIEKQLNRIAKTDAQIQRVQTINGVGRVTAEAIVSWIDDPHRFKSAREVGAYAGLVPWQYQSGNTDRRGRITKRGPRLLRTLLVECAWCSLQYNTWSRETYDRIHAGKQPRRKKAAVAMARKILVLAWAMMRDEVDYDPDRNVTPKPDVKQKVAV